jgi:uncharacterized membrane protein YccF (DUF307 family)
MKTIGNVLWLLLTGLATALGWLMIGLLFCITIIGIPFGKQAFKMAELSLCPFGRKVHGNFGKHPIANVIWFLFGGFGLALGYLFAGLLWCVTIIGIPFGKQCFKLARLSVAPFGATVR